VSEDLPDIVPALAALAGPAGEQALAAHRPFDVTIDDVVVHVRYSSGTTPTVFLSTSYPTGTTAPRAGQDRGYRDMPVTSIPAVRPLGVELRLERDDDRRAKERGVSRELQTGDPEFDRLVYVDSPAPDEVLSSVFATRPLRAACRALLEDGFVEIRIDDEHGEITTRRGLSTSARLPAEQVIRAFAAIAREVPPLETTGRRSRRVRDLASGASMICLLAWVWVLTILWGVTILSFVVGGLIAHLVIALGLSRVVGTERFAKVKPQLTTLAWLGGGGLAVWLAGPDEILGWAVTPSIGLAIGALVGWLFGCLLLLRWFRGRSDSHFTQSIVMVLSVSIPAMVGLLAALVY